MQLDDILLAISKELGQLNAYAGTADTQVEMTKDEFLKYVQEQVTALKSDDSPRARLTALVDAVTLAKNGWEDNATISVSVFSGPDSVQATSAEGEKTSRDLPVPGPQASPAGGAFSTEGGVTAPALSVEAEFMPPVLPQSTPAAGAEGFMAKARELLAKSDGESVLAQQLKALLDGNAPVIVIAKDKDGWPDDLNATGDASDEDSFGDDPNTVRA